MSRDASPARLEQVLHRLGSKREAWQVRALFLGAQASNNVRLGPQHLLSHLFDGEPLLGDCIDDMNASLGVVMDTWNELVEEQRRGDVRLSDLCVGDPPTFSDLATVARRRAHEITWFVRGIHAGGGGPIEFVREGQDILRRLGGASAFCTAYERLLATKQSYTQRGVSEAVAMLGKITIAVLELVGALLSISAELRRRAVDELTAMDGRQTDDGGSVPRE